MWGFVCLSVKHLMLATAGDRKTGYHIGWTTNLISNNRPFIPIKHVSVQSQVSTSTDGHETLKLQPNLPIDTWHNSSQREYSVVKFYLFTHAMSYFSNEEQHISCILHHFPLINCQSNGDEWFCAWTAEFTWQFCKGDFMEIRFVYLSTGLCPKSGIAFLAVHVASTSLEHHFPFWLILGCGKDLFSDVYACSICLGFSCKLIPDAACSYAFAGSLVPADYCWPQLSFPLCANVKWILS